jgi:Tfp pilus assembly protein PilX
MGRFTKNEDGSVLLIALIFVAGMGLVVGGIAELAVTDIRNTKSTREQRQVVYTADAAVQAAINTFRETGLCPSTSLPAVNNISTADVRVDCVDTTSTGSTGLPGNQPPLAIITRPTGGETGITLVSGAVTNVVGGVSSNTDINVSGGATLMVRGPTTTRTTPTGCNGAGVYDLDSTEINRCNPGIGPTASYPRGDDPNYSPEVTTAPPAVTTLPSCGAAGSTVLMPAGTYDDASALTNLFSTCAGRTFHFRPDGLDVGVYYFDFTNSGSRVWTIDSPSTVVVGGTMTATPSVPGSACNETAPGVQFIFGGDSQLNVNAVGAFDLCAQHYDPALNKQQIAIYGLKTSATPPPTPSPVDLPPVTPSTATSAAFSSPGDGRSADDAFAEASVSSSGLQRTITLGGFNLSALPAGSTINGVKLELKHKEALVSPSSASLDDLTLKATVTGTGQTATITDKASNCAPACLTKSATNHLDNPVADLTAEFQTAASLQNLSVVYSADARTFRGADTLFTASLDGARLLVNDTPPAAPPAPTFHAQSGCVTAPSGCAFISTGGGNANLALHGTAYAPLAFFDIHLTNVGYQVFNRGIIARSLRVNLTSSSACVPPVCSPFRLPTPAPVPANTSVVFQATVEGNKRLRALVDFTAGLPPDVRSWSAMNEP